jgi:phosphatidylglycerol:prolipoprotein diacylglycerol transferase
MIEVLMAAGMEFPNIGPNALEIGPVFGFGPFPIRWYSLAYLGGLLFAWIYMVRLLKLKGVPATKEQVGDFMFWAMMGIILGGRLGYVMFYNFSHFMENPAQIIQVWDGGMSFHGGFAGVCIALILYCRAHKIPLFRFTDLIACVSPIGLMLGRLANFINGELWGRAADETYRFAMIFPNDPLQLHRHPSQLYEAALEGLLLLIIMWALCYFTNLRKKPGILTGIFILGYALARTFVEQFREPDAHIGFVFGNVTMGQILSVPMIILALYLISHPLFIKKKSF